MRTFKNEWNLLFKVSQEDTRICWQQLFFEYVIDLNLFNLQSARGSSAGKEV